MPTPKKMTSPVLAARCTKRQKKRVKDAEKSTGLNETDFVLAAVTEFFANHKTPEEQMAAVSRYRIAANQ